MPPTKNQPKQSTVPTGFEVVWTLIPLRLKTTPRTVQAFRCNGAKPGSRIRFGPGTLAQAKLAAGQTVVPVQLANGMWTIVPDPAGYLISEAASGTGSIRLPLYCHFSLPAELLHGMWCFPPETFRAEFPLPSTNPA